MKQLKNGKMPLVVVALLLINGCRSDNPPPKEICILDGFGGGDCIESDGSKKYRPPSEMLNYWSTNQKDMEGFASWCYKTSKSNIQQNMKSMEAMAKP